MSRDSTIRPDRFADRLVGVVDRIRGRVHERLGTRSWEVAIITRRWSGSERGVGTPSKTVLVLEPPPQVKFDSKDRLSPGGREPVGSIHITEVSLRYSEAELQPEVDGRTEVAYRLTEAQGQRQKTVWAVLAASPTARRGDKVGDNTDWELVLNESSPMGEDDGVDAP